MSVLLLLTLTLLGTVTEFAVGQDPAFTWNGFATGVYPAGTRITYLSANWIVPGNAIINGSTVSTWIGIETSDNLNLLQTVTDWTNTGAPGWLAVNENYQWSPTANIVSDAFSVQPGDEMFSNFTYNAVSNSYTLTIVDLTAGVSVTTDFPIQDDPTTGLPKNYNVIYVVLENNNAQNCSQWPTGNSVTFSDIYVEYDDVQVTPTWNTSFVKDQCLCRAHIADASTVQITWSNTYIPTPAPSPAPTSSPSCLHSVQLYQNMTNSWVSDGVTYTQWVVTVSTTTSPIYQITLDVDGHDDISSYYGITLISGTSYSINDWRLNAGYVVPAGTTFGSIGYTIASTSPANIAVSYALCTAPSKNCSLVASSTIVQTWVQGGVTYNQYTLSFTNIGNFRASTATVSISFPTKPSYPSQIWNLNPLTPVSTITNTGGGPFTVPLYGLSGGQTDTSSGYIIALNGTTTQNSVFRIIGNPTCDFSP